MFVSELELKSQLENWFEQSLVIRAGHRGVLPLGCSRREKVTRVGVSLVVRERREC